MSHRSPTRPVLLVAVLIAGTAAPALAACPPPMQFAERKAELMEAVRAARDPNAGGFLSRQLLRIWAVAPDRQAQTLLDLGMARRGRGDLAGALVAFEALIDYCPAYAEGYAQRGFLRLEQGREAPALGDFDAALMRAPDHVGAMAGRATALMSLGRVDDGRAALEAALRLNPWLPARGLTIAPRDTPL